MMGQYDDIMPFQGWDMLGFQPAVKSSDHDWAMPYAIATRLSALT
ncbi:hypothetical protein [Candidatus Symbiothrix dinenymphae]|nr:hypothetical protein [Candidatus Symbiothrix dinenymphae]